MIENNSELVALGAAVRVQRERKEISQEALASLAGLHRTYIGGIERGERNVSYLNLLAIAQALGVSAAMLVRQAKRLGSSQPQQDKRHGDL